MAELQISAVACSYRHWYISICYDDFIITVWQSFLQAPKLPPPMLQLCVWRYLLCSCDGSISCLLPYHQADASVSALHLPMWQPLFVHPVMFSSVLWICMQRTPERKESVIISHLRLCFAVILKQLKCWMERRSLLLNRDVHNIEWTVHDGMFVIISTSHIT